MASAVCFCFFLGVFCYFFAVEWIKKTIKSHKKDYWGNMIHIRKKTGGNKFVYKSFQYLYNLDPYRYTVKFFPQAVFLLFYCINGHNMSF